MKSKRIGIFGGTFDPPHIGHLMIAERARIQLQLDRVIFVPAYVPPHKRKRSSARPEDRLRMTKLAVRGNPAFKLSDVEIKRRGISYTVDTLRRFQKQYPAASLFLIIGSDNFAEFHTWKSYKEILKRAQLVVYARSQKGSKKTNRFGRKKVHILKGPLLDISSFDIRKTVRQRGSIRYLVPEHVERYIRSRHLYRS